MNKISTHAAAELFPALPEGELADLAADIKEHGLREPLVILESTGELLDGRNRLEACRRAGVEPRTVAIEVADPRAYILSLNIHRRHLTKQQRAMVVAMLYPDKGRGQTPKKLDFAAEYLRQARTVLQHNAESARQVLADDLPLGIAYRAASGEQPAREMLESPQPPPAKSGIPDSRAHGRGSRPPIAPDERQRKGATADDDPDFKKCIAAFGMLASIKTDPDSMIRDHGDPRKWRYIRKARQFISELVDSGHRTPGKLAELTAAFRLITEIGLTPYELVQVFGNPHEWDHFATALQIMKDIGESEEAT